MSEAPPEGTPKPAGGRLCFLNGCVPLSHQVAGHMYGKDKVGKWGWRGARGSPSAFGSPRPAEAAWRSRAGLGWTPLRSAHSTQASSAVPQSLATHAAEARKGGDF